MTTLSDNHFAVSASEHMAAPHQGGRLLSPCRDCSDVGPSYHEINPLRTSERVSRRVFHQLIKLHLKSHEALTILDQSKAQLAEHVICERGK